MYLRNRCDYASSGISETSSNSQGRCSYAAEGPTALKTPDLSRDDIENSWDSLDDNGKTKFDFSNVSPITLSKKPPTPPKPKGLTSRSSENSQMNATNAVNLKEKSQSLGNLTVEFDDRDMLTKPSLEKRGSSLLQLNFPPPPPPSTTYEEPLNQIDASDGDTEEEESQACKSELSEKDKSDPKLQPFVMTSDVGAFLRGLDGDIEPDLNYKQHKMDYELIDCASSYIDDDGWGSEFSTNIYDEVGRLNSMNSHDRLATIDDADTDFPDKVLDKSDGARGKRKLFRKNEEDTKEPKPPSTPKLRVKDLKNFFNKKTNLDRKPEFQDIPLSKKERRRQVRSLPPGVLEKAELDISSPVLVKRETFSQMFSKEQLKAYGFPEDRHCHERLVQQTIQQNLKYEPLANIQRNNSVNNLVPILRTSSGLYAVPDMKVTQQRSDYENKYSELICDILTTIKNPIPKPPRRRGSLDPSLLLKNAESYQNHEQIKTTIEQTGNSGREMNEVFRSYERNENNVFYAVESPYENLKHYQGQDEIEGYHRPMPTIPINEEDFCNNNTSLSQEELDGLYASVDFTQKKSKRSPIVINNNSHEVLKTKLSDGYGSDATVYSEPERNNERYDLVNITPKATDVVVVQAERKRSKRKRFTEGIFKVEVRMFICVCGSA